MNKLHMLVLAGLMICGMNEASIMGQEQREVLYTLNTLRQDFANVPMITQNIDMFMGVLEMNIQVNEAKVKAADKNIKAVLLKSAVLCGGTTLMWFATDKMVHYCMRSLDWKSVDLLPVKFVKNAVMQTSSIGIVLSRTLAALSMYDAWKNRSELIEAIALDKEILGKLEEIKGSMSFIEENTDSAENFLLNSAE